MFARTLLGLGGVGHMPRLGADLLHAAAERRLAVGRMFEHRFDVRLGAALLADVADPCLVFGGRILYLLLGVVRLVYELDAVLDLERLALAALAYPVSHVVGAELPLVLLAVVALDDLLAVAGPGHRLGAGRILLHLGQDGLELGDGLGVTLRVRLELAFAAPSAEPDHLTHVGGGESRLHGLALDRALRIDGLACLSRSARHQERREHACRNDPPHADPLQRYLNY